MSPQSKPTNANATTSPNNITSSLDRQVGYVWPHVEDEDAIAASHKQQVGPTKPGHAPRTVAFEWMMVKTHLLEYIPIYIPIYQAKTHTATLKGWRTARPQSRSMYGHS